jgi:hypothetical protein
MKKETDLIIGIIAFAFGLFLGFFATFNISSVKDVMILLLLVIGTYFIGVYIGRNYNGK